MPFVPVPNTIEVETRYLWDTQQVETTSFFERDTPWNAVTIGDWLDQMNTLIQEELMPLLSTSIQLIELVARLLDTASSIGFTLPVSGVVRGGVDFAAVPNNSTYTVSFKTGLTGRSFRGRNYVPGIPDNARTANTIDPTFRTGVLSFYDQLRALATSSSITWVVASRFSGVDPTTGDPIPRTVGVTTPIISVSTADLVLDSQRRRLPGRGQ
jgi:hypothetical protein